MFNNLPKRETNKFCFVHQKKEKWKITIKIEQIIIVKASLSFLKENCRLYHDNFISKKKENA